MIGLQALERGGYGPADILWRAASLDAVAHVEAEFGRQDDAVAAPAQQPAEETLAAAEVAVDRRTGAVPVDVDRVEEIDARVEGRVDNRTRPREVEPAAEVVAAEPDARHG